MRTDWLRLFLSPDGGDSGGGSSSGASGGGESSGGGEGSSSGTAVADASADSGPSDFSVSPASDADLAGVGIKSATDDSAEGADESEGGEAAKPAVDPALATRAEAAGIPKEMAEALGDKLPAVLAAFDRKLMGLGQPQQQPQQQPAPQQQPPVQQQKPPEAPIPGDVFESWSKGLVTKLEAEGFDAEAAGVMAGSMKELAGHVTQSLQKEFDGRVARIEASFRAREADEFDRHYDAAAEAVNEKLFGKGRPDRGTEAYSNRVKLLEGVRQLANGIAISKAPMPPLAELVQRAYSAAFPDQNKSKVRADIAGQLKQQQGAITKRPVGRNNAPTPAPRRNGDPSPESIARIADLAAKAGIGDTEGGASIGISGSVRRS